MLAVQSFAEPIPAPEQPRKQFARWETYIPTGNKNNYENIDPAHLTPSIRNPSPETPDNEHPNMTGRQDNASVKAESLHKDLQNFQIRENMLRTQEMKSHKRSGVSSKPTRPPMEIYSPRNNLKRYALMKLGSSENAQSGNRESTSPPISKELISKNGTKVHFVEGPITRKNSSPSSNSLPAELKSALKRSKSFTADESRNIDTLGFDRNAFPLEYTGLIKQAVHDPNSMSCQKLMELVRLICSKAVENIQYSASAAQLCFSIIEKEHDHTFLESLQNCCREWYNERDKLLRSPFGTRRWTAFVSFLIELFLLVKNQQMVQPEGQPMGPHPNSPMAHLALTLQTLLYECAAVILRPPSLNNEAEIEILRQMLSKVGKQLEQDCAQRMHLLVINIRDAFLNPSITAQIRKTLLEVIELHASSWQLDLSQTLYYFPYTKF